MMMNLAIFHYGIYFKDRTIIGETFASDTPEIQKNKILENRKIVLGTVKNYTDANFNQLIVIFMIQRKMIMKLLEPLTEYWNI